MQKENLAAIDLGTNSCRLMIADCDGKVLYREAIPTKLGEGLFASRRFSEAAVERGLNAFKKFSGIMSENNVKDYRAIATASCRMAQNGAQFVELVARETKINLEVIDGYEEALLNLKGAILNAPKDKDYVLVFDIGGGSTELTLAQNGSVPQVLHTVSIPWGARNASEAYMLQEFDENNNQKLRQDIKKYVDDFSKASKLEQYKDRVALIATSSTPLRLVSMVKEYGCYDRFKCDGQTACVQDLNRVIQEVRAQDVAQKENSPYIGSDRAPIMNAACTIFQTIYQNLGFENVTASLKSAQDAIIRELVEKQKKSKGFYYGQTHKIGKDR